MIWHITPIDDTKPHEESTTCECEPRVEKQLNGDFLVVHFAFDGRHAVEWVNEILNPE
jgi:hypothetical protein